MKSNKTRGFTLLELLMVMAIIAVLAGVIILAMGTVRKKARDTRRKAEVAQIGQLIATSCYMPNSGAGDYDLAQLAEELKIKYPKYASQISHIPRDPKIGTETETHYRYIINEAGKCALYTNLEQESAAVTLPNLSAPTPGGGKGVLESDTKGGNGTAKYYQVSN